MGLTRIRAQQISDIDYKQAVRVITLTDITLSGGAPVEVDGVTLIAGDRILVNGQSNAAQNGLYVVQTLGTGENGTWVRTSDGNEDGEIQPGMVVMVTQGTQYADTPWKLITNGEIIIGNTELTFAENYSLAFGNVFANGTAVIANVVSAPITLEAGDNISIVGNNTTKTVTISATGGGGGSGTAIINGDSNVNISTANADVTVSVNGVSNVTVFGNDRATFAGNLLPAANVTYDLGADTARWNDLWLANSTIHIGNGSISANATSLILVNPNGSSFDPGGGGGGGGLTWTTQANTAPISANPGDFWYDSASQIKYQYIDDGTSDQWVDQSFPTTFASISTGQIVNTNTNGIGNIGSASTHFGNLFVSTVNSIGNVMGDFFLGNGSQLTGIDATSIQSGTSNVKVLTSGGNVSVGVGGTAIVRFTTAGIVNDMGNGVGNIGNSTSTFNTIFARATSAQYADLAERYQADQDYGPGTVVIFGGSREITQSTQSHDTRVAGIISTDPAFVMNAGSTGLLVALTGRVPCRVQGPVAKGDLLVTGHAPGTAERLQTWIPGCVIGKSLCDLDSDELATIEVAVGRF
jgi:hypothetical protein